MANGDKCDNPNVHDPALKCDAAEKGKLVVDVVTFKAGVNGAPKSPFTNVSAKIEGPTKKDSPKTGEDGQTPVVDGLDPGSYKVTLQPNDEQKEDYDFAHATVSASKTVKSKETASYHFQVPFHWLDHEVKYPDKKTFAAGIEYVLRHKKSAKGAQWELFPGDRGSGKTADKTTQLEKIPPDRYKLDLKLVYDPAWGDKQVVIDKAIDLKATVSGFDAGTRGSIEIYDVQALSDKLYSIDVQVAEDDKHVRGLKTSWTPTKDQLKNLKSGRVVFRAVVGSSDTFSVPQQVLLKEKYEVVDQAGKKLDLQIEVRLAGGDVIKAKASGGEAEIQRLFSDPVARIDLPGQKHMHVTFEDDGAAARGFQTP
ncbi:MAG TPA: hypothetical protein VMH81_23275 [Bryobacteraceae bacterium]|nr:hypothetical protein [Bryobacteraceae bacterium]